MTTRWLAAGLAVAMIGGGSFSRADDDTAQMVGSILSGISGMINAANAANAGNSGWNSGYGNYGGGYGNGYYGNHIHSGGNWNGYDWGGYSTYPQSYTSNYSTYGAASAQPTYQPAPPAVPVVPAKIKIVNPAVNGTGLKYHLNGRVWEIPAGYEQQLDRQYVIEFSRGTGFGAAKYQLTTGIYTFQPSDRGWELFRRPW